MTEVALMPFQNPRRDRCGLCRRRLALAYLLLLKDGEQVAGEMELCAYCTQLLRDVCRCDGELEEMVIEDEVDRG